MVLLTFLWFPKWSRSNNNAHRMPVRYISWRVIVYTRLLIKFNVCVRAPDVLSLCCWRTHDSANKPFYKSTNIKKMFSKSTPASGNNDIDCVFHMGYVFAGRCSPNQMNDMRASARTEFIIQCDKSFGSSLIQRSIRLLGCIMMVKMIECKTESSVWVMDEMWWRLTNQCKIGKYRSDRGLAIDCMTMFVFVSVCVCVWSICCLPRLQSTLSHRRAALKSPLYRCCWYSNCWFVWLSNPSDSQRTYRRLRYLGYCLMWTV